LRILVVGNGGREHALLWKLRHEAPAAEIFITRGNGGTSGLATALPLDPTDGAALAGWCTAHSVTLTIVGPEGPLADGIVDHFIREGVPIFGPTRGAAAIEASKAFAKGLMRDAGVPTAAYECFTDAADAEGFILDHGAPIVVKASGLAGGKGAVVCETVHEAIGAVRKMLLDREFGESGAEVIIEEFMTGEELSVLALTDGEQVVLLPPAQDHKRLGEGDTGPNTGGMGAYCPVSIAKTDLLDRVRREVFEPVLREMAAQGAPYEGVLYAGLMITPEGVPSVLEFNARFGDPETQVVLPAMAAGFTHHLADIAARRWRPSPAHHVLEAERAAVTTVLAARGYPDRPQKGAAIQLPPAVGDDVIVFHAGTSRDSDGSLRTAGGRVLSVTGLGRDVPAAARASAAAAERIAFDGKTWRRDIAWREIERARTP